LHSRDIHAIIHKHFIKPKKGGLLMSRVCAISGKGALSGNKRSHSLQASRRKWNVNLQKVRVMVDGKPVRIKISARALKTLKAQQNA
jgi:large subunit ribosomal protein L28